MRTYVSTLGFDEARLTRPILKRGIDEGDEVVVVQPAANQNEKRAEDALDGVESFLSQIEPNISLTAVGVAHDDFEDALLSCSDVLRAAEGTVIVNFGGGAREVLIPLATATLAHLDRVDTALTFRDVDRSFHEWSLPNLNANPASETLETLQILATVEGPVSISELADHSDAAKSTVGRHVDKLESVDAVCTTSAGKTKQVKLTLTGKLLLQSRPDSV